MGLLVIEGLSDLATGEVFLAVPSTPWASNRWKIGPFGWSKPISSWWSSWSSERAWTLHVSGHSVTLFISSFLFLILAGTGP